MPNDNVLKLADRVDDVRYDSVIETLEYVLKQSAPDGFYAKEQDFIATKCVVVMVDDRNGAYRVKSRPSAMNISEEVSLLEIAKNRIVADMFGD